MPDQPWLLRGFVARAIEKLSIRHPVNVCGTLTPEIEKTVEAARSHLCAMVYQFDLAGLTEALRRHLSMGEHHALAKDLLHLTMLTFRVWWNLRGGRVDVAPTPEERRAYATLRDRLGEFYRGDEQDAAEARDAIRSICWAVIEGVPVTTTTTSESTISVPPASLTTGTDEAPAKLPLSRKKAYSQYRHALNQNPEFGEEPTDKEVYEWLNEHREDGDDRLPSFETWCRYVREARTAHGQQKHTPRAGRSTGKSVVREHET